MLIWDGKDAPSGSSILTPDQRSGDKVAGGGEPGRCATLEAWLDASINVHKTIGVETVLSTAKYRRLVEAAKALGFAVWFLYVVLDTPERSIERIKLHVAKGGHPVPDNKVRLRYQRSLEQFPWFLEQADEAWIWDNSGAKPKTIGEKHDGTIELDEDALEVIAAAVQSIATE